jgi:hypothetical protein
MSIDVLMGNISLPSFPLLTFHEEVAGFMTSNFC